MARNPYLSMEVEKKLKGAKAEGTVTTLRNTIEAMMTRLQNLDKSIDRLEHLAEKFRGVPGISDELEIICLKTQGAVGEVRSVFDELFEKAE